jgi:co-chaperonin GroES (HSP10)
MSIEILGDRVLVRRLDSENKSALAQVYVLLKYRYRQKLCCSV